MHANSGAAELTDRAKASHTMRSRSDDVGPADRHHEHLPVHCAECPATSGLFFVIIKPVAVCIQTLRVRFRFTPSLTSGMAADRPHDPVSLGQSEAAAAAYVPFWGGLITH